MTRARIWVRRSLAGLVAIVTATAALVAAVAYATVPPLSGAITVQGLARPGTIIRDANAVPHIFANSVADLYRGLGFAHAQDRLWQMEMIRRTAQGRLSEIFGERTLDGDILMRTLDLYGHAGRAAPKLSERAQTLLTAYAEGVNAFINRRTGLLETRLPPEFLLFRHAPEPWTATDSLAVAKIMALNLSGNLNAEIQRLTLAAYGLSPDEILDIMPSTDGDREGPLPDLRQLYPLQRLSASPTENQETAQIDALLDSGASNNWVVSGERTKSGHPLLANDPHLRLSAPSIWYLAHLGLEDPAEGPANVIGASLPGTPIIVLGRGDTLAWGFTNAEADVQDLFIERINPDNPTQYLTPDGWRPFEVEDMTFRLRGGDTRVTHRLRTRHGPVLPSSFRNLGQILGPRHVAALQWTALSDDDATITAGFFDVNVRNVQAYIERSRAYVVPMQAIVVADTEGHIGMIAPGRIPVRNPANRIAGRAPVPGWDATYDWQGTIPFDELPQEVDPPQGAIGTANARIVGDNYPHLITHDWEPGYRQRRLNELVIARSGHDMETMKAAQLDVFSPAFAELKPLMVQAARATAGENSAVLDQLSAWDATMRAEISEPLIFMAWLRAAVRGIFEDDLGTVFAQFNTPRAPAMIRLLRGEATSRDWCDDRRTVEKEDCGLILSRALHTALADLEQRYGRDRTKWSWGAAHVAFGEHQILGRLPVIGSFFNIGKASPGGPYTLNRGVVTFGLEPPYLNRHASTLRAIYDLGDLDRSLYMQPTGQSGNPFSRYYRTFETPWSEGAYIEIPSNRQTIEASAIGTWHLLPAADVGK